MNTTARTVGYGYLPRQLSTEGTTGRAILSEWGAELKRGLFTLGPAVERLEEAWAKLCGTKHAIGVNSGTDALIIAMRALGIGEGDEVITVPNTFVATVGAIVATGAKPVFVDVGPDYLMDIGRIEGVLSDRTRAIMPVDLTGNPVVVNVGHLTGYGYPIIRDACQSVGATIHGVSSGKLADMAAYSLHPLKNVHACGDGGMVVTDNDALAEWVRMYRNHGLKDRDTVLIPGINSRLDTLQAIAGWHILSDLPRITTLRQLHALRYDDGLAGIPGVILPPRPPAFVSQVFHTYVVQVERRSALIAFLAQRGVETKIHYPVPVHLQPGYAYLGYKRGDFPHVEEQAGRIITLPVHEYVTNDDIDYVVGLIREFYAK